MSARQAARRRGALLLEVIVALAVIVAALTLLAGEIQFGVRAMFRDEQKTRAVDRASELMAILELSPEFQQTIIEGLSEGTEHEGNFGERYPGWFWRLTITPLEPDEMLFADEVDLTATTDPYAEEEEQPLLMQVTVEILRQEDPELGISDETTERVLSMHYLKAPPAQIDLQRDFGVPDEQVTTIVDQLAQAGIEIDPTAINPQQLVQLMSDPENPQALLQLLPLLQPMMQMFSGTPMAGAMGGRGGGGGNLPGGPGGAGGRPPINFDALQDLLNQAGGAGSAGDIDLQAEIGRLLDLQRELGGGAAPLGRAGGGFGGGGGGRGGGDGMGGGRGGGQRGGGQAPSPPADGETYTIEDLLELRDRMGGG